MNGCPLQFALAPTFASKQSLSQQMRVNAPAAELLFDMAAQGTGRERVFAQPRCGAAHDLAMPA